MPPLVLFHEQTGQLGSCLRGLGRYAQRIAQSPLTGRFASAAEVRDWLWAQPLKLDTGDGEHESGCTPEQRSRVWPKDGLNCWEATAHWLGWHLRNGSPIEAHLFDTYINGQRHVFSRPHGAGAGPCGARGGEAVEKVGPMENPAPYWTSAQASRAATTTAVQALLARRRAQGGSAASAFIPPSAASDIARLSELEAGSVEQLRQVAGTELAKAQAAFKEAKGLAWTSYLSLPLLALSKLTEAKRWSPIAKLIEDSETSLATGDRATSEESDAATPRRGAAPESRKAPSCAKPAKEKPASPQSSKRKSS